MSTKSAKSKADLNAQPEGQIQIALRVPAAWLERADALIVVRAKARGGRTTTRTTVIRDAIEVGLDAFERAVEPKRTKPR